jgi:DNA repair ATPase RecN
LHTHSPASYDFKPDADREAKDWSAWVSSAKSSGLHAIALTDHNTAAAIAPIRAAASALIDCPVVLPGVEVTANDGTHLLVVFDEHCTGQHVDEFLGLAGVPVDQRGKQVARSSLSVEQLLGLRCDRGLILGAHVNRTAGLLEHDGQQRIAELRDARLMAVEVDPTCAFDETWFDGSRSEIGRVIPRIWCSDGHSLADLGRRFTWMKMTRPDIEGLRLALLDGSGSLRPADNTDPGDPNKHASSAIQSITVRQAKYMGRSKATNLPSPLTVDFNPWLNALIGSRGTGKSTLVDFCRKAFRRDGELSAGGETSLRAAYDKRMRVPANRGDEGLLTPETLVEVNYRKDGECFVLSWDDQGKTAPISRFEDGHRVDEQGDIRERFPVRIYSQKQLFELAREPHALLTVIDDSADVRGAELVRLRKEAETAYLSLQAEVRALRAQVADLPSRVAALADVRRKLEVLQKGGHAKALSDYRSRRRNNGTWESIRAAALDAVQALGRTADASLTVADLDLGPEADSDPASAALQRAHQKVRIAVDTLRSSVIDAVEQARTAIDGAKTGADAAAWQEAMSRSEDDYRTVAQQLAQAGIANPDEYRDLLQRATALEQEILALEKRKVTADEREREASAMLRRYRDNRSELTDRRRQFVAATSSDLVRVEIRGYAMYEGIADLLRDALGIARFEDDYIALVEQIVPADQHWSFEKLDERVTRLREVVGDPQQQWSARDKRFETALRKVPPERLDRVALIFPDDAVDVSFRDPRDASASWRQLAQGSPGQQTAALLAFVLGYGHEPIILDQPEDDLDNTLIYELVVRRLRETKLTRQVIVVTHNPNIVVHGDAELVVSLEARAGQTQIAFAGGLQERRAREEVCRVMEGGPLAFETRYRRIMLPGGALR